MKREFEYKQIKSVMETTQQKDKTWKCEARVFLTDSGVDVPSLEGFATERES
jgi:hypothetical protein